MNMKHIQTVFKTAALVTAMVLNLYLIFFWLTNAFDDGFPHFVVVSVITAFGAAICHTLTTYSEDL